MSHKLLASLFAALCLGAFADPYVLYVSPSGNDAAAGDSMERPLKTINRAISEMRRHSDLDELGGTICHVGTTATMFSGYAERKLLPRAALRNRGTSIAGYSFPSVDLLGRSRIYDNAIDVGCFESHSTGGLTFFIR